MQRICQVVRLRPEAREEYLRLHRSVWPAVLATITRCNIRNYSIFLHEDLLIAYFDYHGTDLGADMRVMAADPETQRWWSLTDLMQERMPDTPEGSQWFTVPEVFHHN